MKNKLTYDSAIERLNQITKQLESTTALTMEEYKALAKEAGELLTFCKAELTQFAEQLQSDKE